MTGCLMSYRATALCRFSSSCSAANFGECTPITATSLGKASSTFRKVGKTCMQLMQHSVQKSSKTSLPFSSASDKGLGVFNQTSPLRAISGARTALEKDGRGSMFTIYQSYSGKMPVPMVNRILEDLKKKGLLSTTTRRVDLKHLLSAERAARGSFYATRVGFVAIDRKGKRLAGAHNGFPQGVRETLERWSRKEKDFYHLHAECAGIFNAVRHGYVTKGASAYVTHPPCPGCMRALAEAGFSKVVF